jgi:hypothetical protein
MFVLHLSLAKIVPSLKVFNLLQPVISVKPFTCGGGKHVAWPEGIIPALYGVVAALPGVFDFIFRYQRPIANLNPINQEKNMRGLLFSMALALLIGLFALPGLATVAHGSGNYRNQGKRSLNPIL